MTNYIGTKNTSSPLKPSRGFGAIRSVKTVVTGIMTAVAAFMAWRERTRQRHHLERMDDWQLKDIGLNRSDVYREAHKPFWRN